jgi:hypothetical protein
METDWVSTLAYLDVLQPCPTYNDLHTKDWFAGKDLVGGQPRVYEVEKEGCARLGLWDWELAGRPLAALSMTAGSPWSLWRSLSWMLRKLSPLSGRSGGRLLLWSSTN